MKSGTVFPFCQAPSFKSRATKKSKKEFRSHFNGHPTHYILHDPEHTWKPCN